MNNLFISQNVFNTKFTKKEVTINLEYFKNTSNYLTQVSAVADTDVDTSVTVYFRLIDSNGIFTQNNVTILSGGKTAKKLLMRSDYVTCVFSGSFSPTSSETQVYIRGEVKEATVSPTI